MTRIVTRDTIARAALVLVVNPPIVSVVVVEVLEVLDALLSDIVNPVPLQRCMAIIQALVIYSYSDQITKEGRLTLLAAVGQHDKYRHHSQALFGSL